MVVQVSIEKADDEPPAHIVAEKGKEKILPSIKEPLPAGDHE